MRICFLGESFVNGTGDPDCLGWAGRICVTAYQQGHELTYYNLGIRRQTSHELANCWQEEVQRRLPDAAEGRVVFSFGVNDTTIVAGNRRVSVANSLQNTQQILSAAQAQFPVLMVGPPPVADFEQNLRIAELSQQMAEVSQKLGVAYLEVFPQLQASSVWMREAAENDGAHPRSQGYAELAAIVQNWEPWLAWFH